MLVAFAFFYGLIILVHPDAPLLVILVVVQLFYISSLAANSCFDNHLPNFCGGNIVISSTNTNQIQEEATNEKLKMLKLLSKRQRKKQLPRM